MEADMQAAGTTMMLIQLAIMVLIFASFWKIVEKAGRPGWKGIIPIYNIFVLLDICGKPWWWVILFFIPIVNIVMAVLFTHAVSTSYGHGAGFTIGLIFLSFIFYPILAFGDSRYVGPSGGGAVQAA